MQTPIHKAPIVLFSTPDGIEVTLREAIFSITIVSILFTIGFLVSGHIEHSENQKNLVYRQAARIAEFDEGFRQAMDTNVGNAFVQGKFRTVDPVSDGLVKGKWLYIAKEHQRYTMHTRVVVWTDSKGNSHSRTEHYWTWDTVDTEFSNAKQVQFCSVVFPYSKFQYGHVRTREDVVSTGYHKRTIVTYADPEFSATIYTKLANRTIMPCTLYPGATVESLAQSWESHSGNTIFWIVWVIFMFLLVVVFVVCENRWLED